MIHFPSTRSGHPHWRFELRQCLWLSFPLATAQLAQAATGFVDTIMTGLLGSESLAAGGLGSTLFIFCLIFGTSIVSAVSPLVAEAHGAGNSQTIGSITEQGMWMALLVSLPLSLLLYYSVPLLQLLGQDPQIMALAVPYLKAIAWGYFPALMFATLRSFVSAISRPQSVLIIMVMATGINALANYILMFGKWGFPALGVEGTGWASTITYWSMAIALITYLLWQPEFRHYRLFLTLTRFRPRQFWAIAALGLPIGCMSLFEGGLFTAATFLAGQLGVTTLAAHQIALQTVALTFMIPLGISQATTIRVGQYLGSKNLRGVGLAGYVGIGLGIGFMGVMAIALLLFPRPIIAMYLDLTAPDNQSVIAMAIALLAVGGMFQLVDGIQVIAAGALRGVQDTNIPMVVSILAYWGVGLTTSYLAAFRWGWGGVGLWSGLAVGLATAALTLTWRFRHQVQALQHCDKSVEIGHS